MKKHRLLRISILGIFILSLVLLSSLIPFTDLSMTVEEKTNDVPAPFVPKFSGNGSELRELPYFKRSLEDAEWMAKYLQDNITKEYEGNFFHSVNETGGIVDERHFTEDYMHHLGGTFKLFFDMPLFWRNGYEILNRTPAFNTTNNAFYSWVSKDWDSVSEQYLVVDNALPIVYLADMCTTLTPELPNSYGGELIIKNHWNTIGSLFWDESVKLYNYSTTDANKNVRSQAIAALAGFLLHRTNINVEDSVRNDALNRSQAVMNSLISNNIWNPTFGYFELDRSANLITGDNRLDLETNAWGITALVSWYIEINKANATILQNAERTARTVRSSLYNSTYGLLMEKSLPPATVLDYTISFRSNALMIHSFIDLFEITGNLTYFNWAYELYSNIEKHLRDETNGFFYTAIGQNQNTNKGIAGFGLYIRSLNLLSQKVSNTYLDIRLNQTQLTYLEDTQINITTTYYLLINTTYLGVTNIFHNVSLNASSVQLYFLNPSDSLVAIQNGTANANGTYSVNWTIPANSSIGQYKINAYGNLTGIKAAFNNTSFEYKSGLTIEATPLFESIASGNTEKINITITSSRKTNLTVQIKTGGENFDEENNGVHLIANETTKDLLVNATASLTSNATSDQLQINLYNGTVLVLQKNISLNVVNPVKYIKTKEVAYFFAGESFTMEIWLENLRKNGSETVKVSVDGIYIEDNASNFVVDAGSNKIIAFPIKITQDAPRMRITFNLTVIRILDNKTVVSFLNQLVIKSKIDLNNIIVPSEIPHGKPVEIYYQLTNNKDSIQYISIFSNNKQIMTNVALIPGINYISVPIQGAIINPYDFGVKTYQMKIQDSEGNIISTDFIEINVQISPNSLFFGYFLPFLIPIFGIAIYKQKSLEIKKRIV